MVSIATLILSFIASAALTFRFIRYARAHGIEDLPNARSSHKTPTPRGGGLAIAAVSLIGWCALWGLGLLETHSALALIVSSGLIATVGWVDDRRGLSAQVRLSVHLVAGLLFSFWGLGQPLVLAAFSTFFLIWLTNIYNFMDGIDGIAAGEAVTVGMFLTLICILSGSTGIGLEFGILAAASLGFLIHNWQPAEIFMGDVGSGFLGFSFGALCLLGSQSLKIFPLSVPLILLGVFIVDSGITLLRRTLRLQKVWHAHREHAYQHAVQNGHSHAKVSATALAINFFWLSPLAAIAWIRPSDSWVLLAVAYVALAGAAVFCGAGTPQKA